MLKEKMIEFKKLTIGICGKAIAASMTEDEDNLKRLIPDYLDYCTKAFELAEEQAESMDKMQQKLDMTLTKLNEVLAEVKAEKEIRR